MNTIKLTAENNASETIPWGLWCDLLMLDSVKQIKNQKSPEKLGDTKHFRISKDACKNIAWKMREDIESLKNTINRDKQYIGQLEKLADLFELCGGMDYEIID